VDIPSREGGKKQESQGHNENGSWGAPPISRGPACITVYCETPLRTGHATVIWGEETASKFQGAIINTKRETFPSWIKPNFREQDEWHKNGGQVKGSKGRFCDKNSCLWHL